MNRKLKYLTPEIAIVCSKLVQNQNNPQLLISIQILTDYYRFPSIVWKESIILIYEREDIPSLPAATSNWKWTQN